MKKIIAAILIMSIIIAGAVMVFMGDDDIMPCFELVWPGQQAQVEPQTSSSAVCFGESLGGVEKMPVSLGIPAASYFAGNSADQTHARSVWDMAYYNGHVYLGLGDYGCNAASSLKPNGEKKLPLFAVDVSNDTISVEAELSEEQLSSFAELEGELLLPGLDSSWSNGYSFVSYYKVDGNGNVAENHNIENRAHCFGVVSYAGALWAATGTCKNSYGYPVAMSVDGGRNWQDVEFLGTPKEYGYAYRMYDLFVMQGELFAMGTARNQQGQEAGVMVYKLQNGAFVYQKRITFCSGLKSYSGAGTLFDQKLVYRDKLLLVANGHLFVIDENLSIKEVGHLAANAQVTDILEQNGRMYVLACQAHVQTLSSGISSESPWTTYVYSTDDLESWAEELHFGANGLARSFEKVEDSYYFGLGQRYENLLCSASGEILKVR